MSNPDWNAIHAAMRPRVRFVVRSVLRDEHEAEDAMQDTYLHALRGIGALRNESSLPAWILTIARRSAINRRRKRGREPRVAETDPDEPPDWREPLASGAIEVAEAFARLTGTQQRALSYHASGLTMEQAAAEEGISLSAAKTRLSRARASLRRMVLP